MYRLRTVALATVVAVTALIALATSASAHVSVAGPGATEGGYSVVTFRVPNEEASATTTKVVVQLPTDTPIASVSVQPISGWTAVAAKTTLATPITTDDGPVTEAVSTITWTAIAAAAIKPGEFQQFNTEMGPLPNKPSITFKALQTYSNGQVVSWVEVPAPGSTTEPGHPAPVLQLAAASSTGPAASASSAATVTATTSDHSSSNTGPTVLAIIALVLAAGALGLSVVNRASGRRSDG